MIAISIILCGWHFIEERKLLKYVLTIAIAMLFHTTAVIAIVLYVLYGFGWKKIILFILGAQIGLIIFGRPIVMLAMKMLPKYAGYIDGQYDVQGGSYLMLILLNLVMFACVIVGEKTKDHDNMSICALMIACCLQAVGYSMAIFGRVVPYFSIYMIFAIPNIINKLDKKLKIVAAFLAIGVLVLLTYREFNGNAYVTPYYTIFGILPG
jgi:hypothetical protein